MKNATVLTSGLAGIGRVAWLPVATGVALSLAAMANRGLLNRSAHGAVGFIVDPLGMIRTSAVGFAATKVIKTGGASGLAVFLRHGRRRGLEGGAVTASCILASVASFAAFGVLLASTLAILATTGRLTGWWIVAGAWFAIHGLVLASFGYLARHNRKAAERVWRWMQRVRAKVVRGRPKLVDDSATDALYKAMATARGEFGWTLRTLAHAVASKALGALMLIAAASAAGVSLSLTAAIVIYATALTASSVAVTPSGIGVVEASTAAALLSGGVPLAEAALTVAFFRIFDVWIPVIAGTFLGRHELRADTVKADAPPDLADPAHPRVFDAVLVSA
jgi:uncharacterized membrane protein YbhN (UPF0104 family)